MAADPITVLNQQTYMRDSVAEAIGLLACDSEDMGSLFASATCLPGDLGQVTSIPYAYLLISKMGIIMRLRYGKHDVRVHNYFCEEACSSQPHAMKRKQQSSILFDYFSWTANHITPTESNSRKPP